MLGIHSAEDGWHGPDNTTAEPGRVRSCRHPTTVLRIVIGYVIAILIGLALPVLTAALYFGLGGTWWRRYWSRKVRFWRL